MLNVTVRWETWSRKVPLPYLLSKRPAFHFRRIRFQHCAAFSIYLLFLSAIEQTYFYYVSFSQPPEYPQRFQHSTSEHAALHRPSSSPPLPRRTRTSNSPATSSLVATSRNRRLWSTHVPQPHHLHPTPISRRCMRSALSV